MLKTIEYAGRTCYKSHDKITDASAERFCRKLINNKHESVLEHGTITIRIYTNRAIANELERHRIASYSQESTRYCRYDSNIKFVIPETENEQALNIWRTSCTNAETTYKALLLSGVKPEIARDVLPLSLGTEVVISANVREWRNILKQRTDRGAHPQIRVLMFSILEEFIKRWPVLFSDILEICYN